MSMVAWILIGLVTGVAANQLAGRRGVGLPTDALLGILGASVGGFAFNAMAGQFGGVSAWGLVVSLFGAVVVLAVAAAMAGPRRPKDTSRSQRTLRTPRSRRV